MRIIKNCYPNIVRVNKVKCEITEYGYDIWTDMLPYGEDYHQDAICQSLEKKIHKTLESY